MLREIVLDTETTGLDPRKGDRLVEVGCIELVNRIPTGREFHAYINPGRDVPPEAEAVHGLSTSFLMDKPAFEAVAEELIAFIGDDVVVAHNATFDVAFLNAELGRLGHAEIAMARVVDTLQLARRKHPAGPNNLDALCKRYGIDNSKRTKHGALMDSLLLAEVYVDLLGARQTLLALAAGGDRLATPAEREAARRAHVRPTPLASRLTPAVEAAHRLFVATLGPKALWWRYIAQPESTSNSG